MAKGSHIPFLKSFDGALYAGVDSRLWRWNGRAWADLAGVGDKCTTYSAEIFEGRLYIGSTRCGLQLYLLEGAGLVPVASGPPEHDGIYELHVHRGSLYAGTISSYRTAGVFRLDGKTLVKVGGDGVNGSWISPGFYYLESLASFGDALIVTMNRAPLAPQPFSAVWTFDGSAWKPVGLDRMPAAWGRMMNFNASFVTNGTLLIAGGGVPPGNTSVWALSPDGTFALLGGFGARKSWGAGNGRMRSDTTAEYVYRMKSWRGQLVAGFGDGYGMAQVWRYTLGGQ